ncbi:MULTISPECIES: STT3 domain-containing protein [Haloarcula]|uniref:STT3 domain-containing protein n=2 Tax=Haloarculaceae TaxID=1963268 RepID=UPI0023EC2EA0|nr:STT3 domain-containing protein [Halomicroarcula sp. XH51]
MNDESGAAVLEDRPELQSAAEAVLVVDEEADGWDFDDVPVDSGLFGELVSEGVVEKVHGQYRVADPQAVRAVLNGEPAAEAGSGSRALSDSFPSLTDLEFESRAVGLLVAALAVVAVARAYVVGSIYRGGDIVLSGNDPYFYRYHVEQVAAQAGSAADFGALSAMPGGLVQGEPLMVATLWWVASLFGGSTEAIGHVLAWYPVLSALVSAVLLYALALRVTNDRRVGLASVLFLAFIPGHAFRTSLGFADHHAFDYPWLGLTTLALVVLLTADVDRDSLRTPGRWFAAGGLGLGLAGQVLAWEAGPLLILPVGIALTGKTILDVAADRSSLRTNAPVLAGTTLGAILAWGVHAIAGWQTTLVASTPALLTVGILAVSLTAAVVRQMGGTTRQLAGIDVGLGIVGFLVLRFGLPAQWATVQGRLDTLFRSDAIAETYGLFNADSFGFLLLFGFTLVLSLPAMGWGVQQAREGSLGWLVASSYAWFLFGLATIQVRFVGELATFAALFTGVAFVWVASWIDLARPLSTDGGRDVVDVIVPETRTLGALVVLFLLFGGFGMLQVPVKTSQVVIEDGTYEAASAIETNAAERELEYNQNYVLSRWGQNRMYNYFVNGEAESYAYARSNYPQFLSSQSPAGVYDRHSGRVGYVATTDGPDLPAETMYGRMHNAMGSRNGEVSGLGHFQPVYASESGSHKAFALVPGATVRGTAAANTTVTLTTDVSVSGTSFEYERQTTANATGAFAVTVANPGTYTVTIRDGETREVDVSQAAVYDGQNVTVG